MKVDNLSQGEIMNIFWVCGAITFLIIGASNIITHYINWEIMILSLKVSSVMGTAFNFIVSWFFYAMYTNKKKQEEGLNPLDENSAEEIFNEVNSSDNAQ